MCLQKQKRIFLKCFTDFFLLGRKEKLYVCFFKGISLLFCLFLQKKSARSCLKSLVRKFVFFYCNDRMTWSQERNTFGIVIMILIQFLLNFFVNSTAKVEILTGISTKLMKFIMFPWNFFVIAFKSFKDFNLILII